MHQYLTFDGAALPEFNTEQDHGSGSADSAIRNTIGGAVDIYGAAPTPVRRREFTVRGIIGGDAGALLATAPAEWLVTEGGDRLLWAASGFAEVLLAVGTLRAKVGTRGTLAGASESITARLLEVRYMRKHTDRGVLAEIELTFETVGGNL